MKFATLLSTLAIASLACASFLSTVEDIQDRDTCVPDCTDIAQDEGWNDNVGKYSAACAALSATCVNAAKTTTYIWHKSACVAAATCQGVDTTLALAQCANSAIPTSQSAVPDLSTNIYANIVGCSGCSKTMTQQNYIDFIYSTLATDDSNVWPDNAQDVISDWWQPMLKWAATGSNIPYKNFDDFLHYVDY